MKTIRLIPTLIFSALIAVPGLARAQDPNVLIILDNSGSMETNSIITVNPYDASITYAGSYDPTRVYWSNGSILPGPATAQWFPASDNQCSSSYPNLGNTAGASGFYSAARIAAWRWKVSSDATSNTQGRWLGLDTNATGTNADGARKIADVECQADDPADASLGDYLRTSRNNNLPYSYRYTNAISRSFNWSLATASTLYSGNYLNYTTGPATAIIQTRMQVAKQAVKALIDANPAVRLGLMAFNSNNPTPDGGRVTMKIDTMDDARRTAMKAVIDAYSGWSDPAACTEPPCFGNTNYTPTSETLWEAYRYVSGLSVTYGNPSPEQYPAQDLSAQSSYGIYESPILLPYDKTFVILLTDGDPTNDGNANTLIAALPGIGVLSENYLDELAAWMSQNDLASELTGVQTAATYTIALGAGTSAAGVQLLQDTAFKSGGKFYTAYDSTELTNALQQAVEDAISITNATVPAAM